LVVQAIGTAARTNQLTAQRDSVRHDLGLLATRDVPAWHAQAIQHESNLRQQARDELAELLTALVGLVLPAGNGTAPHQDVLSETGAGPGAAQEAAAEPGQDGESVQPPDSSYAADRPMLPEDAETGPRSQQGAGPAARNAGSGVHVLTPDDDQSAEEHRESSFQRGPDGVFRLVRAETEAGAGDGAGRGSPAGGGSRAPGVSGPRGGGGRPGLNRAAQDAVTSVRVVEPENAAESPAADEAADRPAGDEARTGQRLRPGDAPPAERLRQLTELEEAL